MLKNRLPNKHKINVTITVLVLAFLALGCDDFVGIKGQVVDEDGKSMAGAKVILFDGQTKIREELTGKDGTFNIFSSVAPIPVRWRDNKIVVIKDGYQKYEKNLDPEAIRLHENNEELRIILKKS